MFLIFTVIPSLLRRMILFIFVACFMYNCAEGVDNSKVRLYNEFKGVLLVDQYFQWLYYIFPLLYLMEEMDLYVEIDINELIGKY